MKSKYIEILNFIKESYDQNKFDMKIFEFYETRREKNKFGTGIVNYNTEKYFFKIENSSFYDKTYSEQQISNIINPYFKLVEKYGELKDENKTIKLYKYIPAPKMNTYNFLRNSKIPFNIKEKNMIDFFQHKFELMRKNYNVEIMDGTKSSDRWFWGRITIDPRKKAYYGENFEFLYSDILKYCPETYNDIKDFLINLKEYLLLPNKTVTTFSHGDFHDFNFSLNGTLWDIDTFDYNPILNDFDIFYWHFYAREDYLVYKYCPWLTLYMNNELDEKELKKIRNLKKNIVYMWYDEIEEVFDKYNIKENINLEFIFKLFCRVFLINNVIEYDIDDKIKNYKFFNYYLKNKDKNIKDLLFSNEITF